MRRRQQTWPARGSASLSQFLRWRCLLRPPICFQSVIGRAERKKRGEAFGKPSFTWHPNGVSHLPDRRPGRDQHLEESRLRYRPPRPLSFSPSRCYFFHAVDEEMRSCACCPSEWTSGFIYFRLRMSSQSSASFVKKATSFFCTQRERFYITQLGGSASSFHLGEKRTNAKLTRGDRTVRKTNFKVRTKREGRRGRD